MNDIILTYKNKSITNAEIELNTSKSISNRLLILKYLSNNKINIENISDADDTILLKYSLELIVKYKGIGTTLNLKNAGTTYRFLTALLSNLEGTWILEADERMYKRPIESLVKSLQGIDADIEYLKENGFPPLRIKGKKLTNKTITIDASASSQFITALLLLSPLFEKGLHIEIDGEMHSKPYLTMTIDLLKQIGFDVFHENSSLKTIYKTINPINIEVERDWSSASYFYGAFLLSNSIETIYFPRLNTNSLQGDAIVAKLFSLFGIVSIENNNGLTIQKLKNFILPKNFEFDFSNYPDISLTFVVICAALDIPCNLTGLQNLKIKESDRLKTISKELEKFGCQIATNHNSIQISKGINTIFETNIEIETYNDHRIAMSLSLLSFKSNNLKIKNNIVIDKSFPNYWNELKKLGIDAIITN